jgi:hypothetical protein
MKVISLAPVGVLADVCALPGGGWLAAFRTTGTQLPLVWLDRDGRELHRAVVDVGTEHDSSFARVQTWRSRQFLAHRALRRGVNVAVLREVTAQTLGPEQTLGPCIGNDPVCLSADGWVAWQHPTTHTVEGFWLGDGERKTLGSRIVGTGLARCGGGVPVFVDDVRASVPGMLDPVVSGACTVGKGLAGGIAVRLGGGASGVLLPGEFTETPRCAEAGDGTFAAIFWRAPGGVFLAIFRAEDLVAPAPTPPPPPPAPTPQPPPQPPRPEPTPMTLPDPALIKALLDIERAKYVGNVNAEQIGTIMNAVCLQVPGLGMHRKTVDENVARLPDGTMVYRGTLRYRTETGAWFWGDFLRAATIGIAEPVAAAWNDDPKAVPSLFVPPIDRRTTPTPVPAPPPVDTGETARLRAENAQLRDDLRVEREVRTVLESKVTELEQRLAVEERPSYDAMIRMIHEADAAFRRAQRIRKPHPLDPGACAHLTWRFLREGFTHEQLVAEAEERAR